MAHAATLLQPAKELVRQNSPATAHRLVHAKEELIVLVKELSQWLKQTLPQDRFRFEAELSDDDALDSFFGQLANGAVLCELIQVIDPSSSIRYRASAKPDSFFSRENLLSFTSAASLLGVPAITLFEASDLMKRQNEQLVVNSLLQLSRIGAQRGIEPPKIISMEKEIDALEEKETKSAVKDEVLPRESSPPPTKTSTSAPPVEEVEVGVDDIDTSVKTFLKTFPVDLKIVRKKKGFYCIGGKNVHVRILHSVVMVRVGGGWESLYSYVCRRLKMPHPSAIIRR